MHGLINIFFYDFSFSTENLGGPEGGSRREFQKGGSMFCLHPHIITYYIKHHIGDYLLKYETNWQYDKGNLLKNVEFSAQLWVSRALWILSILLLKAGVMTDQNPQAPISWGLGAYSRSV